MWHTIVCWVSPTTQLPCVTGGGPRWSPDLLWNLCSRHCSLSVSQEEAQRHLVLHYPFFSGLFCQAVKGELSCGPILGAREPEVLKSSELENPERFVLEGALKVTQFHTCHGQDTFH